MPQAKRKNQPKAGSEPRPPVAKTSKEKAGSDLIPGTTSSVGEILRGGQEPVVAADVEELAMEPSGLLDGSAVVSLEVRGGPGFLYFRPGSREFTIVEPKGGIRVEPGDTVRVQVHYRPKPGRKEAARTTLLVGPTFGPPLHIPMTGYAPKILKGKAAADAAAKAAKARATANQEAAANALEESPEKPVESSADVVIGKVISFAANRERGSEITINRGKAHGVAGGWHGRVRVGEQEVSFALRVVSETISIARVDVDSGQMTGATGNVVLMAEPVPVDTKKPDLVDVCHKGTGEKSCYFSRDERDELIRRIDQRIQFANTGIHGAINLVIAEDKFKSLSKQAHQLAVFLDVLTAMVAPGFTRIIHGAALNLGVVAEQLKVPEMVVNEILDVSRLNRIASGLAAASKRIVRKSITPTPDRHEAFLSKLADQYKAAYLAMSDELSKRGDDELLVAYATFEKSAHSQDAYLAGIWDTLRRFVANVDVIGKGEGTGKVRGGTSVRGERRVVLFHHQRRTRVAHCRYEYAPWEDVSVLKGERDLRGQPKGKYRFLGWVDGAFEDLALAEQRQRWGGIHATLANNPGFVYGGEAELQEWIDWCKQNPERRRQVNGGSR
jgi:hypothetical protein